MKAPWFPFYTGDFLASPTVQDMEAHEVGAYVLLLARSWQSDAPGYLDNDEQSMRRAARLTAAQWAESRTILLKKWPVVEGSGEALRHNPRLVAEAEKQVELREMKAEAGRKSAERRAQAAAQRQHSANTNPTPVENTATGVGQNGNYSQSQPQPQSQEGKPSTSSFQSEVAAPQKKMGADEVSEPQPAERPPAAAAPGGANDVGTPVRESEGSDIADTPDTPKLTKQRGGKPLKAPPGSSNPADYQLPEWAGPQFVAEFGSWLATRQSRPDCKPLTAKAVQARLKELAGYDEQFCAGLFRAAEQNPHWQGLTFDNTPHKFTQHVLAIQKLQTDAARQQQPERGAKPTENATIGARTLSAQLRAIREQRSAKAGSVVHLGAAAGTNAGLGSAVPPGVGAPQGR